MSTIKKWVNSITIEDRLKVAVHADIHHTYLLGLGNSKKKTTISRARLIHEGAKKHVKHIEPPSVKSMIDSKVAKDAIWFSNLAKKKD